MFDRFISQAQTLFYPRPLIRILIVLSLLFLQGICGLFVYEMGGTRFGYLHVFYLPIILGGVFFQVKGGLTFGLIASLILGPFMPEEGIYNTPQASSSWLMRGFFFCLVGGFAGALAKIFDLYLKIVQARLTTDLVTNLPNVMGLHQLWQDRLLAQSQNRVMVILINRLSDIDKVFGAQATAFLLKEVSQRLQTIVTSQMTLAYVDYATFALLMPFSTASREDIQTKCQEKLGNRFLIENIPVFLEFHFGEAIQENPENLSISDSVYTLIRKAKIAVDKSIHLNRSIASFETQDEERIKRNLRLIHDLSGALETNQLKVVYQPKINLKTGECLDFEALVRWSHPTLGIISPTEFIPMIEQTLLINQFTQWLMEITFSQLQQWHRQGLNVKCGLNFSIKNLEDPFILQELIRLKQQYELPAKSLEIEVTETAISQDLDRVAEVLKTLRQQGINVAIDDFGTGQASLHYLFKLPVDSLKIDLMFIRAMMTNSAAEAIVRSAIILGHDLNLQVIAEGVETKQEYTRLKELGCDYAQGYYIAHPMPVEQTTSWLQTRKKQ